MGWAGPLNPANDFVTLLRGELQRPIRCAMVSSYPDDVTITDRMAWEIRECFERAHLAFSHFEVIDRRTQRYAPRIIRRSNFVILCAGHVPTETEFFHDIHLRELLEGYKGVVMGISAGSMNCAERVYAPPELPGEGRDADYPRYYEGLGLTDVNIMPHFQQMRRARIDGQRLVRDLMTPDSYDHPIYCIPDGSFFMVKNGVTTLHGEAFKYYKGHLRHINSNGEQRRLYPSGRLYLLS